MNAEFAMQRRKEKQREKEKEMRMCEVERGNSAGGYIRLTTVSLRSLLSTMFDSKYHLFNQVDDFVFSDGHYKC